MKKFLKKKTAVITLILSTLFIVFLLPLFFYFPENEILINPNNNNGEYINIDNKKIYVETYGDKTSEAVVFLHGFGGNSENWRYNIDPLVNKNFYLIIIDLLGFGLSDKNFEFDYSHSAQASLLIKILDYLGIDKAHFVAHSMGGNIASHITLTFRERVNKIVLIAPAIVEGPTSEIPKLLSFPSFRSWGKFLLRSFVNENLFINILNDSVYNKDIINEDLKSSFVKVLKTKNWDSSLLAITRDSYKNTLPKSTSEISNETLIIWGDQDKIINISNGLKLNSKIKNSTLKIFKDTGHLPMLEKPNIFNRVILEFLTDKL